MKKFLIFLISTLILLVGCQSNKVNNDVYFDKITSISWLKPDENEVNFNKEDSEKILDILSKAELCICCCRSFLYTNCLFLDIF